MLTFVRQRGPVTLLFAALLLLGAAPAQQTAGDTLPRPPAKDFSGQTAFEVVRVSASDAIVVRQAGRETLIRLLGVYVPQSGPEHDAGASFLWRLLQGECVYLEYEAGAPVESADLRWAWAYRAPDGLFVNLELVRQGYARVASGTPLQYETLLRAYESAARESRKGVWSPAGLERVIPGPASQPTSQAASRPESGSTEDTAQTVYVTPSGQKYHRKDCQYVRRAATAISLKEAKARGLTPCARCKPPR